jgi:hypothetical protein
MSFIHRLFGNAFGNNAQREYDYDPVSFIEETKNDERFAPYARDVSDFALTTPETGVVENGREILTLDGGEAYTGSWVREMFENSRRNPVQPTWIGYEEPNTPLSGVNEMGILHKQLKRHMSVFGKSGNGKSTLLLNMMVQWAYGGFGFCFIDPKGEDAYKLMQMLPEHRLDDIYWIEPGSTDHDKVIGLNFLQTHSNPGDPGFDNEVGQVIDDAIPILAESSSGGFGATMNQIVRNVLRRMLEDPVNRYSVLDLYELLSNQEYRERLPEFYEEEQYRALRTAARSIAGMKQEEVQSTLRRLQDFAENRTTREVIALRDSDIDIHDLVEQDKIIILRASNADDSVKRLVGTTVMRRIWATIRQRQKDENARPYFLVVDEFHNVASSSANVEDMLSMGRSLGLSLTISTQQPSQLTQEIKQALANVESIISFNPGDSEDARYIGGRIDLAGEHLMRLPQYMAYSNLVIENQDKTGPVRTNTFAPYPPLRTMGETRDVVTEIVNKYGTEPLDDDYEMEVHPLEASRDHSNRGEDGLYIVTDDGQTLREEQMLECLLDAQLHAGGLDKWTTLKQVFEQVNKRLDNPVSTADEYGSKFSRAFVEQMPKSYIERQTAGSEVRVRLSGDGRDVVFDTDSGESSSAGKEFHRYILERSYLLFRRLGYDVEIPRQQGEMPDGVASPRYNPLSANSTEEFRKIEQRLQTEYPRLYELFGDRTLHIEAENSTLTKPVKVFRNLLKAAEAGNHCVFVVADATEDTGNIDSYAATIENWIEGNKLVRKVDDFGRVFYNTNATIRSDTDAKAVKMGGGNSVWREVHFPDGSTQLVLLNESWSPDSEEDLKDLSPVVAFDDLRRFNPEEVNRNDFPYHYIRDTGESVTRLYRKGPKLVEEYHNSKAIKKDGYSQIKRPFIPELEFPNGEVPSRDEYTTIVIPDDGRDVTGPQIYENGTLQPLFEDSEDIEFISSADRAKQTQPPKPETEPDKPPEPEQTKEPTDTAGTTPQNETVDETGGDAEEKTPRWDVVEEEPSEEADETDTPTTDEKDDQDEPERVDVDDDELPPWER